MIKRYTEHHAGVAVIKDKSEMKEAMQRFAELEERDIAKKPERTNGGTSVCPECGAKVLWCYNFCRCCGQRICKRAEYAKDVIYSHMDNISCEKDMKITRSSRDNDGWIPVEERLPEESLNSVLGWDAYRERCVFVQFLNGRWIFGNDIEPVLIKAWQPLPEPYRPERAEKKHKNTQQEMEDFWRDK